MSQGEDDEEARILDAAQRLLDEQGPGFTMGRLAEEAGVSRATLYRRVPGKEALAERLEARGIEPGAELGTSSRERILDATHAMIDAHGLFFTIAQVAEQAGVGVATVYRHFEDRDGLLRAFFGERGPRRVAQQIDPEAPLEPTLRRLVASLLRFMTEFPGLARAVLLEDGEVAREVQRIRRGSRSSFSRLLEIITVQVERGELRGDPYFLACGLTGTVLGTTLLAPAVADPHTKSRPESIDIDERAAQIVRLWLKGASG